MSKILTTFDVWTKKPTTPDHRTSMDYFNITK